MTTTVRVLLSVYHGSQFIEPQLESLHNQTGVCIRLGYHMDAPNDPAEKVIKELFPDAKTHNRLPGAGLPTAFLNLMGDFDDDSDFYAFCDQDDIWRSDKLDQATNSLSELGETPTLWVCAARILTDIKIQPRSEAILPLIKKPSVGNALVETIAPGCTMVWNRALHRILVDHLPIDGVLMHDSWVYLMATTTGQVIVERDSCIQYRLHSSNAVGISRDMVSRLKRLMRIPNEGIPTLSTQAQEFVRVMGQSKDCNDFDLVRAFARWDRRYLVRKVLQGKIRRRRPFDTILLLIRIMLPNRFY